MLMFGDSEIRNKVVETVGQQLTNSRQICVKTAPRRLVLVLNMIKLSVDNNTFVCTVDRSTIKLKYFSSFFSVLMQGLLQKLIGVSPTFCPLYLGGGISQIKNKVWQVKNFDQEVSLA